MPWQLPEAAAERLCLAKGYPFEAPARSYLFRPAGPAPIEAADFAGRVPVVGHGSNRAPAHLARKFGHLAGRHAEIPVTFAWLADYDVVYSAHVTQYGAIASNLQHTPGCRVRIALTWLDAAQLQRMHETEGSYGYGRLAGVRLEVEDGPAAALAEAYMYLSDHGCLALDGERTGLAAVPAEARPRRALAQEAVLARVRDRLAPQAELDAFILAAIGDQALRRARTAALAAHALPNDVPHFRPEAG